MKIKFLVVVFVGLSFAFAKAQRAGARVAYVNMEYILESVPEYQEASRQLDIKMQKWKREIDAMQREINQMKESLENEKVLLTKELIEEKEEDIRLKEQDLADYQNKRFNAENGDFILQKQQLIQPVQDQVFNEVQKIGLSKKYDYIIDSSDTPLLFSAERHDISDLVLKAIGRTGKKKEREKKAKELEKRREEPYLNVQEAEEIEEREEAKEKLIEQKEMERAERLRERDSIKAAKAAAFQKRRDSLLALRKQKRDSVMAARAAAREKRQEELRKKREEAQKKKEGGE